MIANENYIVIHGWMVNELELKGNELLVYALIYGFSQDGETAFKGSLAYVATWLNVEKRTVLNTLQSLVRQGLIEKKNSVQNGIKACEYRVVKNFHYGKNFTEVVKNFHLGGEKISPNNNKDIDIYINTIVEYLNSTCHKKFHPDTATTRKHIKHWLNRGYSVEDFKTVIAKKASEWAGTRFENYLTPDTLFGDKFEGYFNAKPVKGKEQTQERDYSQTDLRSMVNDPVREMMEAMG